jgi:UDP-N-acetylmuramate--alanine ligase
VFVDDVNELAEAIVDHARDGDVVISMGAGSIAVVPQRVVDMKAQTMNGGAQ